MAVKFQDPCPICEKTSSVTFLFRGRDYELGFGDFYNVVQCQDCSMIFVSPKPDLETLMKHYPPMLHRYTSSPFFLADKGWKFLRRLELRSFQHLIPKGGAILDVGCSNGEFLDMVRSSGPYKLYGLDFDPECTKEVKAKGYEVWASGIEDAPIPENTFDLIRMNHVIEHLYRPMDALKNILRGLKPGGYFVGETPNIGSLDFKIFQKYWGGLGIPRHTYIFSRKTLKLLLSKMGFINIEILSRMIPTGYAAGFQNLMTDKLHLKASPSGRRQWYALLLIAALPINLFQFISGNSGIMGFRCQKP